MSGHGGFSGMPRRERREGGNEESIGVSGGAEAYNNGDLDGEYEGMTMRQAINHLKQKYGDVQIPTSSKYITGDVGLDIVKATDAMMQDFSPVLEEGVNVKSGRQAAGSWIARAHVGEVLFGRKNGRIEFNNTYLDPEDHSNSTFQRWSGSSSERGGFHFPNNTSGAVAAHEIGHIVDARLTRIASGSSRWDNHNSWNNGEVAGDIIHKAAKKIGISSGSSWTKDGMASLGKRHISEYAGSDVHETLAEAFGDVFANGRNAAPLSRAIYNEAKRRVSALAQY